jgi:hypothetical protein
MAATDQLGGEMDFSDETKRVTDIYMAGVKAGLELAQRKPAPTAKQAPEIWTYSCRNVFQHGKFFCWCGAEEDAWFIADRLNAFDANLVERNQFQTLYLQAIKEQENETDKAD